MVVDVVNAISDGCPISRALFAREVGILPEAHETLERILCSHQVQSLICTNPGSPYAYDR